MKLLILLALSACSFACEKAPNGTATTLHWYNCGSKDQVQTKSIEVIDSSGAPFPYPVNINKPFQIRVTNQNSGGQINKILADVSVAKWNSGGLFGCGWLHVPTFGLTSNIDACAAAKGVKVCPIASGTIVQTAPVDLTPYSLILHILSAHEAGAMGEKNEKKVSKFGFLHRNQFFSITPFTGWSFLYAAKTRKEIILWYMVILSFMAITTYNVFDLMEYHASRPTKSNIIVRSTTSDMFLPNITIQLKVPLTFITNILDLYVTHDFLLPFYSFSDLSLDSNGQGNSIIQDYLCRELDSNKPYLSSFWREELQSPTIKKKATHHQFVNLSNQTILNQWLYKLNSTKHALQQLWEDLIATAPEEVDRHKFVRQLNRITNEYSDQQSSQTVAELSMLESVKRAGEATIRMINISTASHLLTSATADLRDSLHIGVEQAAVRSLLVDFSIIEGLQADSSSTLLVIPQDRSKSMTLKFYFFPNMWLKRVLTAVEEAYGELISDVVYCRGKSFLDLVHDMRKELLHKDSYLLTLHIGIGDGAMFPASIGNYYYSRHHLIRMHPVIRFASRIDECYNGTLGQCKDNCLVEIYLQTCQCVPWTFGHIQYGNKLCWEFCEISPAAEDNCFEQCSGKLKHPCERFIMKSLVFDQSSDFLDKDELIRLDINIPEVHSFAEFNEDYKFSTEVFLSHLGGALEFWSGINVVGLIHLMVFLVVAFIQRILPKDLNTPEIEELPITDVDSLEEEIEESLSKIHRPPRSKLLSWLGGNSFYEQTPMSGFEHIAAAQSTKETIFWYAVVIVLIVLGTINIHSTFIDYNENHTQTTFQPAIPDKELTIPNVTIQIWLPLLELGYFAFRPRYNASLVNSYADFHTKIPFDHLPPAETDQDMIKTLQPEVKKAAEEPLSSFLSSPQHVTGESSVDSASVFDEWLKSLSNGAKAMDNLKKNYNDKNVGISHLQSALPRLIEAPIQARHDEKLFAKLVFLASLKADPTDPIRWHRWPDRPDFQNPSGIGDRTVRQLLLETRHSLSKMFHISLGHKDATVHLTDCFIHDPVSVFGTLVLEFQINILPSIKGVQELNIELYSYMHMWLNQVYAWFLNLDPETDADIMILGYHVLEEQVLAITTYYNGRSAQIFLPFTTMKMVVATGATGHVNPRPLWEMSSNTKDCHQDSLEWCMNQCILELYLSQCDCYPWFMAHLLDRKQYRFARICEQYCAEPSIEECKGRCNPCHHLLWDLSLKVIENDFHKSQSLKALSKLKIHILEDVHPKFIKEYEITFGTFLNNLGALLDLWMGINILTIVHLIVYLLKQPFHCLRKRQNNKISRVFRDKLRQLEYVRAEILSKSSMLRDRISSNASSDKVDQKSSLGWIWDNDFFRETKINGFEFIAAAQHKVEAVFWWLLVLFFFAVTLNNFGNAIAFYNSNPTHTEFSFSISVQNVPIGNLTLTLAIPLNQFSTSFPFSVPFSYDPIYPEALQYLCHWNYNFLVYRDIQWKKMFDHWLPLLNSKWSFEQLPKSQSFSGVTDKRLLEYWLKIIDSATSEILSYFDNSNIDAFFRIDNFSRIIHGPVEHMRSLDAPKRFMLLESFKTGHHPNKKLYQNLVAYEEIIDIDYYEPPTHEPLNENNKNLARSINPRQLFEQASKDLENMIYIDGSPGVEVYLSDWSYTSRVQTIELKLMVPENIQDLTIKIHQFGYMYELQVLEALNTYVLANHTAAANSMPSNCEGMDIASLVKGIRENIVASYIIQTFADQNAGLKFNLDMQDADVSALVNSHTTYLLRPTIRFYSHTKDCFAGSYLGCQTKCIAKKSISECNCLPWSLLYLHQYDEYPICTESCDQGSVVKCREKCEQLLLHPCKWSSYVLEMQSEKTDYAQQHSFTIRKVESSHPVYTEVYDFTFGRLISNLAGLAELWLGLNLLSLIHTALYFTKLITGQCCCKRNTSNKTTPQQSSSDQLLAIELLEERLIRKLESTKKEIVKAKLRTERKT